ncbi:MAG: glycosyltransferase family 4 protein [Rhodobacteraceae bacterium]|nr:glycosyltransferase family 4 protein [Paracoccaceae bacterium]
MSGPRVIAPNLKRRLSGVTATIARLLPLQAREIAIVATGPGLPAGVPHLPLWRVALLDRRIPRVWHARRNTEMLLGLALRHLLRKRLKLVFTSASQRRHSAYTKWLIGHMDAVIATSARTAAYLERPATVILHGIDTDSFAPAPDRAALRARLGLPAAGRLVGCYGRIRAQKGTDVFVDAMIAALPALPDTAALVMGRATEGHGAFLDTLRARVAAAGLADRIVFHPEVTVDRMPEYYAALDLYIAPQRWEGFGLTPLEAMACAVPVIATDVGAFPELVAEGETGRIVPAGDAAAMADAVRALLADPDRLAEMASAARAHARTRFRLEDEAAAITALYRRLLDD